MDIGEGMVGYFGASLLLEVGGAFNDENELKRRMIVLFMGKV